MSYNIDSIDFVTQSSFRIGVEHVEALKREIGDDHPEAWLFEEASGNWKPPWTESDSYRYYTRLEWHGEGSGHTFETFVDKVLPCFRGFADIVICWEGGDSYTGLRVSDGKVTRHKVVMALGEEER